MKSSKHSKGNSVTSSLQSSDQHSLTFWGLIGIVVIFFLWAPFQRGLFNGYAASFEQPIYSALIWSGVILLIISIYLFYHWKFKDMRDFLTLFVWLIPLTYLISMVHAASQHYASSLLYINMMYAVFFVVGAYLTRYMLGNRILQISIIATGYIIVIFGLLNWFGNESINHIISILLTGDSYKTATRAYQDAVMTDANGIRITSVFQYANTYSCYLLALWISSLFLTISSKKWYWTGVNAFMLVPIIVSFLLTLSRGGLVILPIVLLIILLFQPIQRQLFMLVYFVISMLASVLILSSVTDIGQKINTALSTSLSLKGWGLILGASLLSSLIIVLIQHYIPSRFKGIMTNLGRFRFSNVIVPVAAVMLGILGLYLLFGDTGVKNILPANIKQRIENINFEQHSVLERETFYRDAIKLFKDYPLIGAGGGAWAAMYEKYQNNPYTSRQAHNYFLQYLVEVGMIGLLVLACFLLLIFYEYIKNYVRTGPEQRDSHFIYFIVVVSILIHSTIDFNMSYAFLAVLLFLCLGALVAYNENNRAPIRIKEDYSKILKIVYPSLLLVISVIFIFISLQLKNSNSLYNTAMSKLNTNSQDILTPLNQAIRLQPYDAEYVLLKANILDQTFQQTKDEKYYNESVQLVDRLKKDEPFNKSVMESQYNHSMIKGNLPQALEIVNEGLNNFPWEVSLYERGITLRLDLGNKARIAKKPAETDLYWNQALSLFSAVLDRMKQLTLLPKEQAQGRPFNVTNNMALAVGQIYYIRGDYPKAADSLKMGLSDNLEDVQNRMVARWYLASLKKQKLDDTDLYNKLIAKDPTEANQIQALADANFSKQ